MYLSHTVTVVTLKPGPGQRHLVTDLTADRVADLVEAYEREEPFALVERERLDTLPAAARDGDLLWRDVEWIVRWYHRRHLDDRHRDRRVRAETAFRNNPGSALFPAIQTALETEVLPDRLGHLTDLRGIDLGEATAVLFFLAPSVDIVMSPREWAGLERAHLVRTPYPSSPDVATYDTYRRVSREHAERIGVDLVALQRALWRLGDTTGPKR
ncbi:MAG: hypothetical protein ACOC0X_05165 [Halobacteriota archaeon]